MNRWVRAMACGLFGVSALLSTGCGSGAASGGQGSTAAVVPAASTPASIEVSPSEEAEPNSQATPTPQATLGPPVPISFHYVLPANVTTSSVASHVPGTQGRLRRVETNSSYVGYTSPSTSPLPITISLNITPLGGTTSSYTGTCTAGTGGTSGTCAVTFTAAPGPTTFAGTISATGGTTPIATFSQIQVITSNAANTINFTANPVVASVVLSLTPTATNAGTAADIPLSVNVEDINNNTIAGNTNYVDSNGNPVYFTLSAVNTQAGGNGTVSLKGPARVIGPASAPIYAHYDGGWLGTSTISVASSSSAVTTLTPATLTITPHTHEINFGGGTGGGTSLCAGPDGNIWFSDVGNSKIGMMTTGGSASEWSVAQQPGGCAVGPDGNVWFGSFTTDIFQVTIPGHVITPFSTGITASSSPRYLALGDDGNLWFTENSQNIVARITSAGTVTEFTGAGCANAHTTGIVRGPDGNTWFSCGQAAGIGYITPTGGSFGHFTTGITGEINDIIVGPDGNLWYCSWTNNVVGKITTGGTATQYTTGITGGVNSLTAGPDGNVWFTDAGAHAIGRITPAGLVTEYKTGMTATATPYWIVMGPDGNLWFTESNLGYVAKFVY